MSSQTSAPPGTRTGGYYHVLASYDEGALSRFGRMATAEVQAVCDLPRPRAEAELWGLAADHRVIPVPFLTGTLWELA